MVVHGHAAWNTKPDETERWGHNDARMVCPVWIAPLDPI